MAKGKEQTTAQGIQVIYNNKKARHDYEIIETVEAGLVLFGSEVKSIRDGGVNLRDSYVRLISNELFLVGAHISPYSHSRADAHPTVRDRKLLLNRREIDKLAGKVQQKGLTIVPLRIYFRRGKCKLEIGVGKGRKLYDKRQEEKTKVAKRQMERAIGKRD